jgi:Protein of unknown function (DUF3108)
VVRLASLILIGALIAPLSATATTLGYDAYVGETKVGGAEIVVDRVADSYQIQGRAWSEGLFRWLTQWRSHFSANGHLEGGLPVAEGYSLLEQARNKVKEITLANGHVKYLKNGQPRDVAPPASRLDLLSALFVPNGCDTSADIHNGKDRFFLELKRVDAVTPGHGANLRCDFEVRDQDNEKIDAIVWLGVIDGFTVPVRLDLSGALEGTLKLRV